ncbi:MAG TPA: hypothetical protein DEP69_04010 [Acidimicrobiaceae bacterium]|nr:hypothetical protein [Acidimicrobiaceae bacterium]
MHEFVGKFGAAEMTHIPDADDNELWSAFGVRSQPWWAIIRTDGSTESGRGFFPGAITEEAIVS